MENTSDLKSIIQEWISIDDDMKVLQNTLKEYRNKKKIISAHLLVRMKETDVECVRLKEGSIEYKKRTTKKPLNAKTLSNILQSYYNNDSQQVEQLTKFVMDNRDISVSETICHKTK